MTVVVSLRADMTHLVSDRPPSSAGGASEGLAERLAEAAHAARRLCDALWDSLHEELSEPRPERVHALSERLAAVSSSLALLIDATAAPSPPAERIGADRTATADPHVAAAEPEPPQERRRPPDPVPGHPSGPAARTRLVDEQGPMATVTPLAPAEPPLAGVAPIQPHIDVRDPRGEQGPSVWVESVGRMLARHAQDRLPFAVLLVEMVDVAHLERSETPHDLHDLVAQVERALCAGMRDSDELSRETLGRYWLLAPETNGTGARMLAERLAELVRGSTSHRGVPMEVAIGIAVCPQDGTEAPALAARADLGVYSARATGRSVAHTEPPSAG